MRVIYFSICLGLLLGISCNQPEKKEMDDQNSNVVNQHTHETDTLGIELNNGEKWKVDAHMLDHIRSMENEIGVFEKKETKDYAALTFALQVQIDSLTSNCTMTGKAHDELHKWLLPYIDLVDALSGSENITESEKQFHNIQHSFETFNKYFQ
jgi:hypothetical protein